MTTTAIENCPESVGGFLEQEGTDSAQIVVDHHLHRGLGFRSVDAYVRERLGLSPRKVWALVKVEKTVRRELQGHHITFRSRGDSHARSSRTAICAAHHHHGIHAGVIRAVAPRWIAGTRLMTRRIRIAERLVHSGVFG